jgi:calcineurin-like phosphoesterase family protein
MAHLGKLDPNSLFLISDTHFGHKNILKFADRPFESLEHMHAIMIQRWNEVVPPDATVLHLGDFAMGLINAENVARYGPLPTTQIGCREKS